ncbi:MAG: CdaR family protein [Firmicutes bacterium]|nr:CdaR family protein [Bacillota bacterium]
MLQRLLKNNIGLKLIAFFMALILWTYVTGDLIRDKVPEVTRPYRNVPLEWLNLGEQLELMEIPEQIDVVLSGRSDTLNSITPQNLKVFVDLRDLGVGQHRLSPNAEVPAGIKVLSFDPQQVVIILEEVESPQMPVELDVMGAPASGFSMGEARIVPSSVFVQGTRTYLKAVDRIRVIVNVDGANSERRQMVPVQAVDSGGQVLDGVRISPSMVEVFIPFAQPQKEVPVEVPLQGSPAEGYKVQQILLDPATVTIEGSAEQLATITEISTEAVDIAGATENIVVTLTLNDAEGVAVLFTGQIQAEVVITNN